MKERKMDYLRRVAIPKEFSRKLKFVERQQLDITIQYGKIHIKKFEEGDLEKRPYVGIVRNIDNLTRVTIPVEYLRLLCIRPGDTVNIELEGEVIKISKKI